MVSETRRINSIPLIFSLSLSLPVSWEVVLMLTLVAEPSPRSNLRGKSPDAEKEATDWIGAVGTRSGQVRAGRATPKRAAAKLI